VSAVRNAWAPALAPDSSPVVRLSLLGGFEATVGGEPVPHGAWRLRKARELVKLLALAPRHRLHREQAMDALWRDRSPAAAVNNLHQAVYVARRALVPGVIQVREEMLQLHAEVDVTGLELAAAEAHRTRVLSAYRAALALYAGELLPENRYDDWVEERREELVQLAEELEQELAALTPVLRLDRPPLPAGVAPTELEPRTEPNLVVDAVAAAIDVRATGQSVIDALCEYFAPRSLLIVLDNCEHAPQPVRDASAANDALSPGKEAGRRTRAMHFIRDRSDGRARTAHHGPEVKVTPWHTQTAR
jgi:hypothetical protein